MKHTTYIFVIFFTSLSIISCKKDLDELNKNPNFPAEVHPSLLLRNIIYDFGEEMSYEGFVAGNLLSQHFTMVDFNLFDRHNLSSPQLGGNPWPSIYKNLFDNEIILNQIKSNQNFNIYEGPALILKAYMTAVLTDIYGDVPYSEAFQGYNGIVNPKYDLQKDIYTGENGILDYLDKGINAIQSYSGNQSLEGDILYLGDLNLWVKFANSLKIKYMLRISDKENFANELQTIFDSGNFINSSSENATFNFSNERPNSFRMQQLRDGDFNLFVLSETMEDILKNFNDPRLQVFYRPVGNDNTNTQFLGLLNGPDASQTSISVNNYSLPGTIFRENTGELKANFMTAWETHFLLAEAAERGYISATSQNHYELGVQLAFEYWQTNLPPTYLSTDSATFGINGANKIEQIITQKWIANTINGYEGWIEYRRTGFPTLKNVAASLNNNLIPVRMPYPADETSLNSENFLNAVGSIGNSVNNKVWWDAN